MGHVATTKKSQMEVGCRHPVMMLAWFSSSLKIVSPGPMRAEITPMLA
jgi:hypothetical protein